jgi:hypothetical protein
MQIARSSVLAAATGLSLLAGMRSACALDPKESAGTGGIGMRLSSIVTGSGKAADDGLARPGLTVGNYKGGVGVTRGGVTGSTNPGTEAAYHASGMGRQILGGVCRSTMETVPGRTPTYIQLLSGKRAEPWVANKGI